jgi:hypothetical protein
MKLVGDVSEEHKKLAEDLEEMERYFDGAASRGIRSSIVAKGFVCLAHDWYKMGSDENGERLLEKAELVFPNYFKSQALIDADENVDFGILLKSLSVELASILISRLTDLRK